MVDKICYKNTPHHPKIPEKMIIKDGKCNFPGFCPIVEWMEKENKKEELEKLIEAFNRYSSGRLEWSEETQGWRRIRKSPEKYELPDETKRQHIILELLWLMTLATAQIDKRLSYLADHYGLKGKIISAEVPVATDFGNGRKSYKTPDISIFETEEDLENGIPYAIFEVKVGNHLKNVGKYTERLKGKGKKKNGRKSPSVNVVSYNKNLSSGLNGVNTIVMINPRLKNLFVGETDYENKNSSDKSHIYDLIRNNVTIYQGRKFKKIDF